MTNVSRRITVLGSINMDLMIRCGKLPKPGETIIAQSALEAPGGKGANQAVAAARLGAEVSMIGRVGDDPTASRLLQNLANEGIQTFGVKVSDGVTSGLAIVAVDAQGENSIMVVPGANHEVTVDDVASAADVIRGSDILLLQLEIPIESVLAACELAREAGVRVILDPAPAPSQMPEELLHVDLLCPNRSEAAVILGRPVQSIEEARYAARELNRRGVGCAIITLGSDGAMVGLDESVEWLQPHTIQAVDTTAAGDAFAAALAVHWGEGSSLIDAARFACAAGACAATCAGAQPAMPRRADIERLLASPMA